MKKSALRLLRRRHAVLLKPYEDRFASTYRGVMRDLKAGVNFASRQSVATRREWKGRAVEALRPVYHSAILAGGQGYLKSITIRQKAATVFTKAKRREASRVVMTLEEQFQARLEETIDTTFDSLEEILDEAGVDGLDAEEIDDLIDEEFDDILGDRTDSIATTEANGAINSVQDYLALQLAELQEWVTAEDDRVRPTHVIYGEAGPKPVGFDWAQLIPDAGYTLRFPCDPACHEPAEVVNCRCFPVPSGEVELSPDEMKDYLSDFEMDPEDVMLSEDQEAVYVVNQYTGKTVKGDKPGHEFRGNQYSDGRIENDVTGSHDGQVDGTLRMRGEGGAVVGYLDWVRYGDEVSISMVETSQEVRGRGIARALVTRLLEENPDARLSWGMTTPEGTALRAKLEAQIPRLREQAAREAADAERERTHRASDLSEYERLRDSLKPGMSSEEMNAINDRLNEIDSRWGGDVERKSVRTITKGDRPGHPFRGNQYLDPGQADETDREGVVRRRLNEARQTRYDDLVASGHSSDAAAIRVAREQRENKAEDEVRAALTDDLRQPKYRGSDSPYAGHCYVASEAVYHLLGGKASGYVPQFIRHEGEPHWFLRSPDGRVIDPTRDQFRTPVPYDRAKGKGFLTAEPSARARKVLTRVRVRQGRKGAFALVLKDFDPGQPRDEQGRWVDIFGGSQPTEHPVEAQTEDPAGSDYAVDPDDPEQAQAGPPRMVDDEYKAKSEKLKDAADALAKVREAKLQEEAVRLQGAKDKGAEMLAAADTKANSLEQVREAKSEMLASKAGDEFDRAAGRVADLTQQRVDVDQKREALLGSLTEEEIAKLPEDKRAEIVAFDDEHARLTEELKTASELYLKDRWGSEQTWENGRSAYVSKIEAEYDGLSSQLKFDPLGLKASADTLDKIAAEMKDGEYKNGAVATDLAGRKFDIPVIGNADQIRAAAALYRASAEAGEAGTQRSALKDSMDAIDRNIAVNGVALGRVSQDAEIEAIASQGVDFIAEKCFRDDAFYKEVHERTADEWQHIGGEGPARFRFAAQAAFGLDEGGTFDSKQGRFITDMDDMEKTYPGSRDEIALQAGAMRREYMETQAEISEGFTFNIAGDEDIDSDALSQMEQDAWNELGTSDKVDIIEGSKSLKEKALEWGMDNEDEVYKKAQEEDSASEPFAYEYVSTKEARDALADNEDAVAVIQKVNDFYAGRDTIEEDDTEDSMGDAMHAVERMQDQAESRERMTAEYVADRLGVGKTGSLLETIEGTIRDGERIMRADFTSDEEAHKSPFYEDLKYLSEARQAIVDYKGGEAGKPIPDASKIAEYVVSVGKFERQWAQERISEFEGEVASNFDSNALRDAVGDDRWESGYDEARRDWLDPYYLQTYAEADPDNEIYQKFSENYEPDEYPRPDPEEVQIDASGWPHKLIRTVNADVSNYTPNYAESWAYDRQSFGSQAMEDKIDHAQILVFQGAKNWTTPAGQHSMGATENEFIVLSQPPKWVREARERWEKVLRTHESEGKLAQREALMDKYRQLQRLQDFGTSEQHYAMLQQVQSEATALGLEWDTLIEMARKAK